MNTINAILNFLKGKRENNTATAPEGYCPNCWGRTEYEGQFFDAIKNQNIDVNNIGVQKGWIQDYADKYLNSILLQKQNNELVCVKCKVNYRPA